MQDSDAQIVLAALDLGLQAWRTTPSRERFVEAVAALGRMRAEIERLRALDTHQEGTQ
jgi:hypothetical protein